MARRGEKYIREFDKRTGVMHVHPRATPVSLCHSERHPNAADWEEVFGERERKAPHGGSDEGVSREQPEAPPE